MRRDPVATGPALGLAVTSGLAYFAAFPGVGIWPLGFVALTPLLVALRSQSPSQALLLGWTSGFVATALGFHWLVPTLATHGGFATPIAALLAALLAAYQAGRLGCAAWLAARAAARGWPFELVFALGFAASEVAYPVLFPWSFAAIVHDRPALLQSAELFGPSAVTLVLLAANLSAAELCVGWLERRSPRYGRALLLALVAPIAAGLGAWRMRAIDERSAGAEKARVLLVQANRPASGGAPDPLAENLQLRRAAGDAPRVDLVVFGEASVDASTWESHAQALADNVFASSRAPTLFGVVLARPEPRAGQRGEPLFFNSALLADGGRVQRYDKQRLLPFAERLPLRELVPALEAWSPSSGRFAVGTPARPLALGPHELAVFVCYEDLMPGFVNDLVRAGSPDLLVNLTNDAWFGDSTEPWAHLALAKLRAVEHRRYLVRSTNSGISAVIDPVGRVVASAPPFRATTLTAEVAWLRDRTAFELWGEGPLWVTAALCLLFATTRRPTVPRREAFE